MAAVPKNEELDEHLKILADGIEVKRVKRTKIHKAASITIDESQRILKYPPSTNVLDKLLRQCARRELKSSELTN
jgi:hypothetical protein